MSDTASSICNGYLWGVDAAADARTGYLVGVYHGSNSGRGLYWRGVAAAASTGLDGYTRGRAEGASYRKGFLRGKAQLTSTRRGFLRGLVSVDDASPLFGFSRGAGVAAYATRGGWLVGQSVPLAANRIESDILDLGAAYNEHDWKYDWVTSLFNDASCSVEVRSGDSAEQVAIAEWTKATTDILPRGSVARYHQFAFNIGAPAPRTFELHQVSLCALASYGSVYGWVTASTGEVLPGAVVTVYGRARATTGADGFYRIEQVPVGDRTVQCECLGYFSEQRTVTVEGAATRVDFTLEAIDYAPTCQALPATDVTQVSATLNGQVNPRGFATTAWIEWRAETSGPYNATSFIDVGSGTSNVTISVPISGLTAGTQYYYRVVGSNAHGITYSSDIAFTTSLPLTFNIYIVMAGNIAPPHATIVWATDVPSTSQVFYGTVSGSLTQESPLDPTLTNYHSVQLSDITAVDTTYYFIVRSTAPAYVPAEAGGSFYSTTTYYPDADIDLAVSTDVLASETVEVTVEPLTEWASGTEGTSTDLEAMTVSGSADVPTVADTIALSVSPSTGINVASGTVSFTVGQVTLTGSGTNFLAVLASGSHIWVNGCNSTAAGTPSWRTVVSVTNNTLLTVNSAWTGTGGSGKTWAYETEI